MADSTDSVIVRPKYKIIGEAGDYQILELFGNYRLSKKRFKTLEKAQARINELNGSK